MAISNVLVELILAFAFGLFVGLTLARVAAKRKKEAAEHAVLEEIRAESGPEPEAAEEEEEADDQANDPEPEADDQANDPEPEADDQANDPEPDPAEEEEEEEEEGDEAPEVAASPKVGGLQLSHARRAISFVWGYKGFPDRITTQEVAEVLRVTPNEADSLLREAQVLNLCFEKEQDQVWEITIW